jgi:hypothetical protein
MKEINPARKAVPKFSDRFTVRAFDAQAVPPGFTPAPARENAGLGEGWGDRRIGGG